MAKIAHRPGSDRLLTARNPAEGENSFMCRSSPPQLIAPPGACDCHIHIFDSRFPAAPTALFVPPPGDLDRYRAVQRRLGLERVIIVQSSAYANDNRCMLDALARLRDSARGIAMVAADVSDEEIGRLTRAGVCGARFLMEPGGLLRWDELERLSARLHEFGWHINIQVNGHALEDHTDLLARLPGQVIIDHVGMFIEPVTPDHPAFQALLKLVARGNTWVKLSAPYAGGRTGDPPYPGVRQLARVLVRQAADRLMWGSNWPHPFTTQIRKQPAQDDAMMLDLLLDWVQEASVRDRILADNPAALFGFSTSLRTGSVAEEVQ